MTTPIREPELSPETPAPALSAGERDELKRGTGSRLPLGLVLLALAFAIALPRLTDRRVAGLRDEINDLLIPARLHVYRIQLDLALLAAQQRGYRITSDPLAIALVAESRARRHQAERELIELTRRLDAGGSASLVRPAERLRDLDTELDSLVRTGATDSISPATFREQRRRFLAIQALADSMAHTIDLAAESRRTAIGDTESRVALLTGLSLLLGFGAAYMVARLGGRFRDAALRLDESEQRSREIAERERAARIVVEHRERELAHVTESRGRLLRGFTHDVKNPLGAADGYLALVDEGVYGELPGKARDAVSKVRRSIGQALELIGQLLEIARAEAGQLNIRRQEVDVLELVRDIVDLFAAQAKAKEVALDAHLPTDLAHAITDGMRVRQVVGNLVSNAVKYTPPGGHVVVRVSLPSDGGPSDRDQVVIDVVDDGPGIPPDKLSMLFKEFTRFDPDAAEGAGVGLAISQKVAEALGGRITVETGAAGSKFSLHLPVGNRRE